MTGFQVTLVSVLALQGSFALKNLDEPRWKSFRDAELECADYLFITNETLERYHSNGYPNERSVRKLLYCVLINLKAWNEDQQKVKDNVFSQFFIPSTTDCKYKQHTQECLDQNVDSLNKTDKLGRAYQTFQCYFQNYAGISDEAKWIPYSNSDILQTTYDCMRIENFSPETLLDFCQGRVESNPDYPIQAQCFFARSGFYNKSTGIDLEKLYVQFGAKALAHGPTKLCLAEGPKQYCKEPERFGNIRLNCLLQYLSAVISVSTAASNILGNPPECVIPPSPPPKTQPCYNGPCV